MKEVDNNRRKILPREYFVSLILLWFQKKFYMQVEKKKHGPETSKMRKMLTPSLQYKIKQKAKRTKVHTSLKYTYLLQEK